MLLLTHYQTTNFRLFQTKKVCRQQFQIWRKWQKVIQTGRKHCGKRRNCHYEQFLLFPQCFQKVCFPGASKGVIVWEWFKPPFSAFLTLFFTLLRTEIIKWVTFNLFSTHTLNMVESIISLNDEGLIFLQDVHFVTDGLSDTKSQPKSCRKIYIFINVTSALPDERYK